MNPPKLRFLKGKSDTRYPLAHCWVYGYFFA